MKIEKRYMRITPGNSCDCRFEDVDDDAWFFYILALPLKAKLDGRILMDTKQMNM